MTLNWRGRFRKITATGRRGIYTITAITPAGHLLTGVGHDGMPLLDLPVEGRRFDGRNEAKHAAMVLDRARSEAEVSGT